MKTNVLNIKKFDIVIILIVLFISFVWILSGFIFKSSDVNATITVNGQNVYTVKLSSVEKPYVMEFNHCSVLFESDGVSFESSDCKNQLCVKSGKISSSNSILACVPNRVVVTLSADKKTDFDVLSY